MHESDIHSRSSSFTPMSSLGPHGDLGASPDLNGAQPPSKRRKKDNEEPSRVLQEQNQIPKPAEDGAEAKKQEQEEFRLGFRRPRSLARPRQRQPSGPNHFRNVSDELMIKMFKYLPKTTLAKVALTCRRFKQLTADKELWQRLDLGHKTLPSGVLGQVLHRGVKTLRCCHTITASPVLGNYQGPFRLEYLDLSGATLALDDLCFVLSACTTLRKVSLESMEVSDIACLALSKNLSLNTLNLCMTTGLTPEGLRVIFSNCTLLRELNLGWADLDLNAVEVVVSELPLSVERLNLAGCRFNLLGRHVERLCMRMAASLVELDLSDCGCDQLAVEAVVEHLPVLESLSTSRCYNIPPAAYVLLQDCARLRYLNVYGILRQKALDELAIQLAGVTLNKFPFSSVARPTVGIKRTSIWGMRVRE